MKFNAAEISRFAPFPLVSQEIDKNKIKIEWKIQKRFSFCNNKVKNIFTFTTREHRTTTTTINQKKEPQTKRNCKP